MSTHHASDLLGGLHLAELPPVFGPSGPTAHRRFTEWTAARLWAKLHRLILGELGSRGVPDLLPPRRRRLPAVAGDEGPAGGHGLRGDTEDLEELNLLAAQLTSALRDVLRVDLRLRYPVRPLEARRGTPQ